MLRLLDPLYCDADERAQSPSLMAGDLRADSAPSRSRRDHRLERIIQTER